jgi:hypothetical protein
MGNTEARLSGEAAASAYIRLRPLCCHVLRGLTPLSPCVVRAHSGWRCACSHQGMERSHSGIRRLVCRACALTLVCGCLAVTACAGSQKGKVVEKTLDTMSEKQRRGTFDTMAAVLDRNPEMVDELYAVTREHPQMFVRFLANSSRDLKEPELARTTASLLVANPESLQEVMRATLQLAQKDPEARTALAEVMAEQRTVVADILTDHPDAMRETMNATLRATEQKPGAREALLASMRASSDRVAGTEDRRAADGLHAAGRSRSRGAARDLRRAPRLISCAAPARRGGWAAPPSPRSRRAGSGGTAPTACRTRAPASRPPRAAS